MITLLRAQARHHEQRGKHETWFSFHSKSRADPLAAVFGTLEHFNEDRLPPGADILSQPRGAAEIVTYVHEGALAYDDSTGHSGVIQAGEFERTTIGHGIRHSETNASRTNWAHSFHIWLRPSKLEVESEHEQKRFSAAERRNGLRVIASLDARRGSLRIQQDALIYSALLNPGQHVVHEIGPGRSVWIHLVQGEVTLGDVVLTTGDGVGVRAERSVSLTAREGTEILFIDLGGEGQLSSPTNGSA